ncbi:helix-turn-helix domain-containing protein [Kribbella sp. NPDC056345]|uniref:helix-turn-helix domain-containing protein n=1 Tax=Kribbella sp. NPDC056345 TaxID=3345789 RepID=UPI0035D7EDFE
MSTTSALGRYLRARRAMVRPEDAGLDSGGHRRVPGLRREEVARLAGISLPYYTRLEQGSNENPSSEVLNALARTLALDEAATRYLHELTARAAQIPADAEDSDVSVGLRRLLDSWSDISAIVQNRYGDVLAASPLAPAVLPVFTPGTNVPAAAFLTDAVRSICLNWEVLAPRLVAGLRALAGTEERDQRLLALTDRLSAGSAHFRQLWARHDTSPVQEGVIELQHPDVGRLTLRYDRCLVAGAAGQLLVVHQALPGTGTEQALQRLADLQAEGDPRTPSPHRGLVAAGWTREPGGPIH